ncbi:adenylate/guanylate cyclase domain-containing protein [Ferrovibrio xuzhouensis]|uniref:Adenylate/guanylate cyclase domain-containing protein n=1 Tax=Ferrovibrio xuzhouensis TaxID=1576914 RepID=A0ABV7VB45_9PROT
MTDAAAPNLRRKLTTIFCADVQGYSTLVEADEVGTVNRLKQYRAVMTAEIERHHGRVINTWGDGLLAEFGSPVEAMFGAVETQRRVATLNAGTTDAPPMQFRIGINLGDVMIDGDDIYGEGVNIAARLESLADPGGICISGTVFEQVRKKLDIGFSFMGPREIKNIAEPVPAYRVLLDGAEAAPRPAEATPAPGAAPVPTEKPKDIAARLHAWRRLVWRFGVILVFLVIINLVTSPSHIWFFWPMLGMGLVLALRYPSEAFPEGLRRSRRSGD